MNAKNSEDPAGQRNSTATSGADSKKGPSLDETLTRLSCTTEGLSSADIDARVKEYGHNEIVEKKVNPFLKFLTYFWGPIPWMIEVAAILSAAVADWTDFGIILVLLLGNGVVGFWEEFQSGNAIAALKEQLALEARVKRDGKWTGVTARELVPGDVIRVRLGDIVPADALLFDDDVLEVDQSALTGESLPVSKSEGEVLYSGSIIDKGEADALVYATGAKTYFGKTAELVESGRTASHFQKAVLKIGDFLIGVALVLVATIFGVALFRHESISTTLQFALVLTVAAVPVAMPTVLSVTMAVGARLLAGKQAIVSRLASIEELAGMDILCSDKTGTLTQNKLTLGESFRLGSVSEDEVIRMAALASREEDQDTIDLTIIRAAKTEADPTAYQVTDFLPFDPVAKRTEATIQGSDGNTFKVSKGAPQVILALVDNPDEIRPKVDAAVQEFAERGFRSLGVARTTGPDGSWEFLGVLPLFDPPREDSKATIQTAGDMGIKVKMVTGDQLAIGKEIAGQLGMSKNILDAELLSDVGYHQARNVDAQIEKADGFAQVFPEHKYHIVEVLQKAGHIVGMTGDGVNDAPALGKADAGIAVSGATDAARAAASIVLLTPGLSVIIDAVKESRKIFQRMNSYATYRIAETIRVLLFMTLAILIFNFYPVTPVMIVLLALLNDGAILSIAYDRTHYSDEPERWNMPVVLAISTALGIAGLFESFGLFYLGDRYFHLDRSFLQTLIYLKLSVAGHLTIFVTRTRGPFWSVPPARVLLGAVFGTQALATLIAVYGLFMTPIGWKWAAFVWAFALVGFIVEDVVKLAMHHVLDPETPSILHTKSEKTAA